MHALGVTLGITVVALLPGAARGGCSPGCFPEGDFTPQWSSDGSQIAFFRGSGSALEGTLVRMDVSGQSRVDVPNPSSPAFPSAVVYSPDLSLIAYPSQSGPLVVRGFTGGQERPVAPRLTIPVAWSPDGTRIAYFATGSDLGIARADGGAPPTIVPGLAGPAAWSPDGEWLAVVAHKRLTVLKANGSDQRMLADDVSAGPAWSADGRRIAFAHALLPAPGPLRGDELGVAELGSGLVRRVAQGVALGSRIAWSVDGSHIVFVSYPPNRGFSLDFGEDLVLRRVPSTGGKAVQIGRGRDPTFSPDGKRLAFVAWGPCEGTGLYLSQPSGGSPRRLTSTCTVRGTARADVMHGTVNSEELLGLGGDDRIYAAQGHDWLNGGLGDDLLVGGRGRDTIWGGSGHDRIYAGAARDAIYVADGRRDVVSCGTNIQRKAWEHDEVFADRFDRVNRDCEVVHRS
jgi:hypothetical protein